MDEQHMYHHNDATPKINVKAERNSRGYNYEASITGCDTAEQAVALLDTVMQSLARVYGAPVKE